MKDWADSRTRIDPFGYFCNFQPGLAAHQRLRHDNGIYHCHIQATFTNRIPLQTDQAELPPTVLLWGVCQCYQNLDLGYAYCQSTTVSTS